VITDVAALSRTARARGVALHLDAAQAWGKVPVALSTGLADYVSFSGPKIGGLSGSGVLWSARAFASPLLRGKQEGGRRGGTENLLAAVALGAAAQEVAPEAYRAALEPLRLALEAEVLRTIRGARVHGSDAPRVANTSNFGFEGVAREGLVAALDQAGYALSAGSACASGAPEPSRILVAMGLSEGEARAAVRVSLGTAQLETGTMEWIPEFAAALARAVGRLRSA
jgi:cysteine desulfurase